MRIVAISAEGRDIIAGDIRAVRFRGTISPHIGPETVVTLELIYDTGIKELLGEKGFAVCILSLRVPYCQDPVLAPAQPSKTRTTILQPSVLVIGAHHDLRYGHLPLAYLPPCG